MSDIKKTPHAAIALYTILVLSAAIGNLSQTALNVMMNYIVADYGISLDVGQWLTTIYILSLGIAVPLTSYLTKKMSMRAYTFMTLALFFVGSLISFAAPVFVLMLVGRVMQAVSCGLTMPVMQSIAMTEFAPNKRATAMGIAGVAMGFAPNIGPTLGGLFVQTIGWRYCMLAMSIVPLILFVVSIFVIKDEEVERSNIKLDIGSFALSIVAFGGLLTALSFASSNGLKNTSTVVMLIVGIVCLVVFLRRQHKIEHPLIDLNIMKSHQYYIGFWLQNLLYVSFMGVTLAIPLFVQDFQGATALDSGMVMLPGAIVALIFNPLSGILGDKIGKVRVMRWAAGIMAVGSVLALTFTQDSPIWYLALCQCVRNAGISSSMGCGIAWMMEKLDFKLMNDGSSFSVLVRQAAASFGTSVMVLIITTVVEIAGQCQLAYSLAFGFSMVTAIAMFVMTLACTRPRKDDAR